MIAFKSKFYRISFLGVLCGDAILIRFWGNDEKYHNILIDGGFVKTYKPTLKPALIEIRKSGEKIDLVVGTHYDGDHIGGILALINDTSFSLDDFVDKWMINFDLPLVDSTGAISVQQLITLKGKLCGDQGHFNQPILFSLNPYEFYGLTLTILSPDAERYQAAHIEIEKKSSLVGSAGNDYEITIEAFSTRVANESPEDASPANGSSIAFLLKAEDYSCLLLADAFPSVICKSIRALEWDENRPLEVDSIKLSHHGSRGNISNELLAITRTLNYVISGNAINTYNLPNKETIARILIHGNRRKDQCFNFYFTHRNDTLENMFSVDGEDVFVRYNFKIHFPESD
ncbi:MAG: MBL fold metallo-hydrolase [Flavobacterium sp.]|nr:MAG: MBL fold metallo-hydrolase [Flavobacterium sp.]